MAMPSGGGIISRRTQDKVQLIFFTRLSYFNVVFSSSTFLKVDNFRTKLRDKLLNACSGYAFHNKNFHGDAGIPRFPDSKPYKGKKIEAVPSI